MKNIIKVKMIIENKITKIEMTFKIETIIVIKKVVFV
jgi:hypothetical protein